MPSALRLLTLAFALVPVVACSSADADADAASESSESSESSLASTTKTFVVPVDERAQRLCRDETNRHYCTAGAAQRAASACLAKIGATSASDPCKATSKGGTPSPRCVRYESVSESCRGTAPVYPSPAACKTPRVRSCHFYSACLEPTQPCGEEGYALGYGERYCYAFKNAQFSAKGDAWRDSVMVCLQKELVTRLAEEPATCSEIEDFAFGSHPGCYTQPGHSICFLPPSDLAGVFSTIGLEEALDGRTQRQIRQVVATCVAQTARWLFGGATAAATPTTFDADLVTDEALSREALRESYTFWTAKADALGVAPAR